MKVSLSISKILAVEYKIFICLVMEAIFNSVFLACSWAIKTKWGINEKVKDESVLILKIETLMGFLEPFHRKCNNMDFSKC